MSLLPQLVKLNKQFRRLLPNDRAVELPSQIEVKNKTLIVSLINHSIVITSQAGVETLTAGDIIILQNKKKMGAPLLLCKVEYTCNNVRNDFDGFIAVCTRHNKTYKRLYYKGLPFPTTLDLFFFKEINPNIYSIPEQYYIYMVNKAIAQELGAFKVISRDPIFSSSK